VKESSQGVTIGSIMNLAKGETDEQTAIDNRPNICTAKSTDDFHGLAKDQSLAGPHMIPP